MSNFTPPDAHNIILDFTDPASGNTNLTFGDTTSNNSVDALVNLQIISLIHGKQSASSKNQILAIIDTSFTAQISGKQNINYLRKVRATVNTNITSQISGYFDLNFIVGVSGQLGMNFQKALSKALKIDEIHEKPVFKALNSAFFYDRGLTISNHVGVAFEKSDLLYRSIKTVFENASGVSSLNSINWQENERIRISRNIVFDDGLNLPHIRLTKWQEMIRKRKQITYVHEVAHVFEKRFQLDWDKGLEINLKSDLPWEVARAIYYRKSSLEPFPPTPIPEYVGSTDLNFVCLCHEVDSHDVILNFGADECIPSIPNKNWWYIVNKIEVTRLDNEQMINVLSGNYRTDRSSWCWTYNLVIPYYELSKLDPIDNKPVILKIVVNGYEHLMLLENRTRSRQFAQETYNLSGRSVSALLDSPSSPPRAFLQENERTSVQLVQTEIDRSAYPDLLLNWQLIDDLGWIVPTESFSYSGLTPIKAIQEIANAGGGFVYSEADSQSISIKPFYKKTYWDPIAIDAYDILLPESIVTEQSTDYESYPDYNGITLTNDKTGLTGQIKRTGTNGDVLYETVNNNLFTSESVMGSYGKSKLAKSGLVESHTFTMPLTNEVGQCKPSDVLAFNADWWGIVDSISVSFTYSKVTQQITVERVNHE